MSARSSTRISALVVAVFALSGACKRSDPTNESKQMPKLPPPPAASVASMANVGVSVDGAPAPPIDAAKLDATKPEFEDGERRAWPLATLLGAPARRDGVVFTVEGEKGMAVRMRGPASDGDALPVLVLNRRGELLAAMIDRDDPFPPYHGRGRRLERRGDPLPRVASVTHIDVSVESREADR